MNLLVEILLNRLRQEKLNSDSDEAPRIGKMKKASIYQPRVGRNFDSDEDLNYQKRAVLHPRIGK